MTFYFEQLVWTASALVGLFMGVAGVREASLDMKALKLLGKNGQKKLLASASLFNERNRIAIQLMFVAVGVTSVFQPLPANPHNPIAYMLIVASFLLNLNSYNGFRVRRLALAMPDHDEERDIARDLERDPVRDEGRDSGRDPIRDISRDTARDIAENSDSTIKSGISDGIRDALTQLHNDNLVAAETLVVADEETVRKVKPIAKP